MIHLIRLLATAILIYGAVWFDSKILMTLLLAFMCLANELQAQLWRSVERQIARFHTEMLQKADREVTRGH